MTCRAPTSGQACSGTPTGQLLTYDNEGRTTAWQNAQSSPTSTEQMAYDGEGNRVALVVNGGTPTYYLGSLEEVNGSTLTKYFTAGNGLPTSERVGTGGAISYLASDGLGSVSEALDGSGNATFQQLFTPYGTSRFSSGTSPTTRGFTGQRADSASGLDYYNARYYDPLCGQFTSADTEQDGLNRYAYVRWNPETYADPSGHRRHSYHRSRMAGLCGSNVNLCHSSNDPSGCKGYDHCVIIEGGAPSSGDSPSSGSSGGIPSLGSLVKTWGGWITSLRRRYKNDVGFIINDTFNFDQGANQIHSLLQGLKKSKYRGTISAITHSAGAAALFHYMAQEATFHRGDPVISRFVALDAPTDDNTFYATALLSTLGPLAAIASMAIPGIVQQLSEGWDPWEDWIGAGSYVLNNGTKGTYAYDAWDPISGPMLPGPWGTIVDYGFTGNPFDFNGNHGWPVLHPSSTLLDLAAG